MAKNWKAVADEMNTRMGQLGLSQKELAERSKVSTATLRLMQQGADAARSPITLAAVSVALGWPSDYLADVAAGRPTSPGAPSDLHELVAGLKGEVADLREELSALQKRVEAVEQGES